MIARIIDSSPRTASWWCWLTILVTAGLPDCHLQPGGRLPSPTSRRPGDYLTDFPGQAPQVVEDQVTYP